MNKNKEKISRRKTKQVLVGNVAIGGNAPVSVQSMTNTKTRNVTATIRQITDLERAGCEIVRVAVPDLKSAQALADIKKSISIPIIADIHFNYKLALKAMENGADKIRINPGNIGSEQKVKAIIDKAKDKNIPIRIGVNSGSLDKKIIQKYGGVTAQGLAESAFDYITLFQKMDFKDIIVSLKASDVKMMIEANRIFASKTDYPLHLGVTESGIPKRGIIHSSVGIGTLLANGIGDTIRVSLTGNFTEEIHTGYEILRSLQLREHGVNIISCPTCGRIQVDLIPLVEELDKQLMHEKKPITVAVMGCAVNGPGEARKADIGVACGKKYALLFKKGKVIKKIRENEIVSTLLKEIQNF
ncbi:MAG: flavodoxin-dependent (E)-4-hydroxy-3-methylbut-2-enyl-diphosphate synthase [bacterium]